MLQTLEKRGEYEMVLFCQTNTLKVEEYTERSQTCEFLMS